MPGYELSRFVGLSQIERRELICGICQDILRCPVITNCCLQTFCKTCIIEWLQTNKTCPFDRKELFESQLTPPPRLLTNMLAQLKIQCNNREFGCCETLLLENLESHTINCSFNRNQRKQCDKCYCDRDINHDCIASLLKVVNDMMQQNILLRKKHKKQKRTLLRTIEDLTQTNDMSSQKKKLPKSVLNWIFSFNLISLLLSVIIIAFMAYQLKTIFQKALTGNTSRQSNPLLMGEKAIKETYFYSSKAYKYLENSIKANVPQYWESIHAVISSCLDIFWQTVSQLMLYLLASTKDVRQWIDINIPLFLETITDHYVPYLLTVIQIFWRSSRYLLSNLWSFIFANYA